MAAESAGDDATAEDSRVVLKPKLDLKESEKLAADLQLRRGEDITIDAGEVEHFGAHALQTLIVAAHSWRTDGHGFAVTNLSQAAQEHLAVMGCDQSVFEGERTAP